MGGTWRNRIWFWSDSNQVPLIPASPCSPTHAGQTPNFIFPRTFLGIQNWPQNCWPLTTFLCRSNKHSQNFHFATEYFKCRPLTTCGKLGLCSDPKFKFYWTKSRSSLGPKVPIQTPGVSNMPSGTLYVFWQMSVLTRRQTRVMVFQPRRVEMFPSGNRSAHCLVKCVLHNHDQGRFEDMKIFFHYNAIPRGKTGGNCR